MLKQCGTCKNVVKCGRDFIDHLECGAVRDQPTVVQFDTPCFLRDQDGRESWQTQVPEKPLPTRCCGTCKWAEDTYELFGHPAIRCKRFPPSAVHAAVSEEWGSQHPGQRPTIKKHTPPCGEWEPANGGEEQGKNEEERKVTDEARDSKGQAGRPEVG